jgi:hypothetical protein
MHRLKAVFSGMLRLITAPGISMTSLSDSVKVSTLLAISSSNSLHSSLVRSSPNVIWWMISATHAGLKASVCLM